MHWSYYYSNHFTIVLMIYIIVNYNCDHEFVLPTSSFITPAFTFSFQLFYFTYFFSSNFSSTFPLLLILFTVSIFLLFTPRPFHWFVFLLFTDLSFSFSLICLSPFHWFVFLLFTNLSSSFSLICLPPSHWFIFLLFTIIFLGVLTSSLL